ncbi:MAG: hypothetical protein WBY53_17105 [Acidobacteriaceae bacterium]
MDIHAPMEPIHSWRDIALHLCIITIGLFIALSLEALVEYFHDLHLVHEARANIRHELQIDDDFTKQDINSVQHNIDVLKTDIATIHKLQADPKAHGSLDNTMSFNSLEDAAWRTARDTGALSFMPYQEVQRYSDLYMLEGMVNQKAIAAGEESFQAEAPLLMGYGGPGALPPDEYTRMLHDNATAEIDLFTLKQYLVQLDQQLQAELKT